ncbi:transcriptional regulator [Ruminococcus sp.]|uniref:transcriptional regulator n=1 Tax=Ruminococcus sp. TaxID=41978 RepID=UPI003AB70242
MDKEKILELSRKESKNQDIYEKEVLVAGNKYSCIVAAKLALILCISLDKKF